MSARDGGPAFPWSTLPGMTLRDWFAVQALLGMLAGGNSSDAAGRARAAYNLADEMIKARGGV